MGEKKQIYLNKPSSDDCTRNSEDLNNKHIARWGKYEGQVGHEYSQTERATYNVGTRYHYDAKIIISTETPVRQTTI